MAKPILDPVTSGAPKAMSRRTKGTPTSGKGAGTDLQFNYLPPGLNIQNQALAADLSGIMSLSPIGPIVLGTSAKRG